MSNLDNQMKKGVLSIVILKIIDESDVYGYEIIQKLDKESSGFYRLKEGTLYPVLYRLEESGWIESYKVYNESEMKMPRKYYRILPLGKMALIEQIEIWAAFCDVTNSILAGGDKQ